MRLTILMLLATLCSPAAAAPPQSSSLPTVPPPPPLEARGAQETNTQDPEVELPITIIKKTESFTALVIIF